MRRAVLLVMLAACGRFGFDDRPDDGGVGSDAAPVDATPEVIAYVQPAENDVVAMQSNSVTFGSPVTKNDLLIVECDFDGDTLGAAFADSLGNTFTVLGPFDAPPARELVAYAIVKATGPDTVTSTLTAQPPSDFELRAYELTGISTAAPIDQTIAMAGTTSGPDAITGPPLVTEAANELIFAIAVLYGTNGSAGTGFTLVSSFDLDVVEDRRAVTPGSYQVTASSASGNLRWELFALGLRPGP